MRRGLALVLALACARPPPPVGSGPLAGGVAARAGVVEIPLEVAAEVARAQRISPLEAARACADDAVAAQAAQAKGLDKDVSWRLRALRARLVIDRLREEARAAGPPTDDEIREMSAEHWQDFDAPESRKVIHAIVLKPKTGAPPADAVELAQRLHAAVVDAADEKDFEQRASNVSASIKVERLPPFVQDGRVAQSGYKGGLDKVFAAAAFELALERPTSRVVETKFGWHVIRLLEIRPPHAVDWEERRHVFAEEVSSRRAQKKHDALLAALKAKTRPSQELAAEALMGSVKP